MKKTILAFVAGAVFATAGSVYADEIKTMIGKQIEGQFPVKVNGVPLEQQAIVVDGTSHLPVRAVADALNMDIVFDSDLGIEVSEKEEAQDMPITVPQDQEEKAGDTPNYGVPPISKEDFLKDRGIDPVENKIKGIENQIKQIELQITFHESVARQSEKDGDTDNAQEMWEAVEQFKSELESLKAEKAALEQQ